MTRKEQIKCASIEYTLKNRPMCVCGDSFTEMADELNRNHAFEEGVKWADNNPLQDIVNLNDVWHDANEKPRTKEWLLVQFDEDDYDTIYFDNLYIDMWSTWCKTSYVIRWAYISDLLPKQFGNSKQPKRGEL